MVAKKNLPSLPFLFIVAQKMTTMSLLSSFVSFCYYKKYDNGVVVFLFANKKLCFFSQHNTIPLWLKKLWY
jgi:hypothetical protein